MKRLTVRDFKKMKDAQQKICMLTCYDAMFGRILDEAGVDMLLVGDSLGMVIKGEESTLNVTIDEVAYHTKAVSSKVTRSHIVGDMPFMSYQANDDDMLKNAAKLLQAGAQSVKIEGGAWFAPKVTRLVEAGIPVMGHIGNTPQSVNAKGGYCVAGKTPKAKEALITDALALQAAGAYAIVLECVQSDVAKEITELLKIPTIGIGSSAACDGQVLVLYDLLGLNAEFKPRFLKVFVDGQNIVQNACKEYIEEVRTSVFPSESHSYLPKEQPRLEN